MSEGITKLTIAQINEKWVEKIRRSYEEMNAVPDMEGMIRFLKSPAYSISFQYALCRFLRKNYVVSDPNDIESYISLMLKLAKERGMEGQFQGKLLRKYLQGKQENVSRRTLMKMAFAFGMEYDTVCELLEAMGETPYNLRDPYECICFFCQSTEETNYWAIYQQMVKEWEDMNESPDDCVRPDHDDMDEEKWESSWMEEMIMDLSFEEDIVVRQRKMMEYLKEHRQELYGFRRSAYGVMDDLLEELKKMTRATDDTDLTVKLWKAIWVQHYTEKQGRTGVNRSDFVPWKDLLDLPKAIYKKPLWRARLNKLRQRKVPVEKRDILFLNCMRWAIIGGNRGGIEAMNEFMFETNGLLGRCGLSMIYPPNPYDRMILLAIASSSPIDMLSDLFTAATDEEALEKRL